MSDRGRERETFGMASKLSKIKSTVGQVLNPVVLTTFCFHSIIFVLWCCFDGRQQRRRRQRQQHTGAQLLVVRGLDGLAVLVL